ncbi:hypothetical protein UFOVP1290_391 [uncultured Caudovirales phage]|uniref:Uncharacterized protein n=1 Tax=uncultured Caudovirales phage TaxID=2100421 RepID=A0A6J5RTH9_9CAUD|nr:hypothetical protein UFOVP1290_391 [uncultured Caudovirales phage]
MKKFISLVLFIMLSACMVGPSAPTSASIEQPKSAAMASVNADQPQGITMAASNNSQSNKIEQVLMSRKCCDDYNRVRCILGNWTPVGDPCFCYYQGWGHTC